MGYLPVMFSQQVRNIPLACRQHLARGTPRVALNQFRSKDAACRVRLLSLQSTTAAFLNHRGGVRYYAGNREQLHAGQRVCTLPLSQYECKEAIPTNSGNWVFGRYILIRLNSDAAVNPAWGQLAKRGQRGFILLPSPSTTARWPWARSAMSRGCAAPGIVPQHTVTF